MDYEFEKKLKRMLKKEIENSSKLSGKDAKKIANKIINLIKNGKISLEKRSIESYLAKTKSKYESIGLSCLLTLINMGKIQEESQKEIEYRSPLNTKSEINMATNTYITGSEDDNANNEVIGRAVLTPNTPSTATRFYFWVKDDLNIHVEPGTVVTVSSKDNQGTLKVVGIVEDVKAMSEVPSTLSEYYGYGYGNPSTSISTHRPIIRECMAKVICRNDGRIEPLLRKYPVFLASRKEIIEAYSMNIHPEDRILIGFTKDSENNFVPIYADFNYMFGYNGVHINIAGASGLAAKTSYALFLILSALAYSKKNPKKGVAVVAFNVKERDLLDIVKFKRKFRNMNDVVKTLKSIKRLNVNAYLWEEAKKEGIDPFELLSNKNVHIYEPGKDFKYGFMDLVELGDGSTELLRLLFDKEDLNENFEALLYSILYEYGENDTSFDDIIDDLTSEMTKNKNKKEIIIGGIPIYKSTVGKFLRRIEVVLNKLDRIIDREEPRVGKLINLAEDLRAGHITIINIEPLPDRGKRLVFLSVLRTLNKILEAKKSDLKEIEVFGDHYSLDEFPDRVAVFVDELNKFAPRGREYSSIKAPIIDIAARGRSIGLSLIGAQQMASQVDEEILANCSTFAVGRSHPIEIGGKAYEWLKGGLRDRIMVLQQGQLIVYHAIHTAPTLIFFPIPLHRIPDV